MVILLLLRLCCFLIPLVVVVFMSTWWLNLCYLNFYLISFGDVTIIILTVCGSKSFMNINRRAQGGVASFFSARWWSFYHNQLIVRKLSPYVSLLVFLYIFNIVNIAVDILQYRRRLIRLHWTFLKAEGVLSGLFISLRSLVSFFHSNSWILLWIIFHNSDIFP